MVLPNILFLIGVTHPVCCKLNVMRHITYTQEKFFITNGPNRVLIIGSSTGYGIASRITTAFGSGASTIGIFLEKKCKKIKKYTSGWYQSEFFEKIAKKEKIYVKNINGDTFYKNFRYKVIEIVKKVLRNIDLVIYSIASPVRKLSDSKELLISVLKPIGEIYNTKSINIHKDHIFSKSIKKANKKELQNTITIMGGQNWEIWISELKKLGILAEYVKSIAYSYIGSYITFPIYWHGTLGSAKEDLDRAAISIRRDIEYIKGVAYVTVLKSVITQSSSAIHIIPLYISIVFYIMKKNRIHEYCIEHIDRLFRTILYCNNLNRDNKNRIRLDELELYQYVQNTCSALLPFINYENMILITDYIEYKKYLLQIFGFQKKFFY